MNGRCRHQSDLTAHTGYDSPWTADRQALWQRIQAHPFDPDVDLSFTRRLARDRDWASAFARGAVREYARFCFLAVTSPTPVTPSEEVDEVWHLHLTYTRDYWDTWCRTVLQMPLHHDPTRGGPAEQRRFRAQYAATLALYERFFGSPPEAFWPATHRRFRSRPRYRVLDSDCFIAIMRPGAWLRRIWRSA